MPTSPAAGSARLARFGGFVLAANVAVVLWGAFVRATGSGAGCGGHWPLCNGEVVPRSPRLETVIEFTHRASSGVALLLVAGFAVAVFRGLARGHAARKAAAWAAALMASEAALGAALVLFRLVADNESMARALFTGAHLLNTFLLLGALALGAHWSGGNPAPAAAGARGMRGSLALALGGWLLVGSSGTVAALGDTLHPAQTLAQALAADLSPTSQVLLRLRVLHPFFAVGIGLFVLFFAAELPRRRPSPAVRRLSRWVSALVLLQLVAGTLNMALLAPVWMQLGHLLLADGVWIATVLLAASAAATAPSGAARRTSTGADAAPA